MSHWNGLDVAAVGKAEGPFAPKCPANGSSQVKFHFQRIENQTDNWPVKYFNAIYQNASENCSPILSGWLTGWLTDCSLNLLGGFGSLRLWGCPKTQTATLCLCQSVSVGWVTQAQLQMNYTHFKVSTHATPTAAAATRSSNNCNNCSSNMQQRRPHTAGKINYHRSSHALRRWPSQWQAADKVMVVTPTVTNSFRSR